MTDLPLTIPVHEIVWGALVALRDCDGLDRDEAYLLARLEAGETLELTLPDSAAQRASEASSDLRDPSP
jgi:hypothetical protein